MKRVFHGSMSWRCRFLLPVAWAVLFGGSAFAWGGFGHKVVGETAWRNLSPQARREITIIARDAPGIFGGLSGEAIVHQASVWPDEIRVKSRDKEAPFDEPLEIFLMQGVTRASNSEALHFADYDQEGQVSCPEGRCVIVAIKRSMEVLEDRHSTPRARAEALCFLVHGVGDAHQPLHAGRLIDRGGNLIAIDRMGDLPVSSNLHRAWDFDMLATVGIEQPKVYVDERLAGRIVRIRGTALKVLDPAQWIADGYDLAIRNAYRDENNMQIVSGRSLSDAYVAQALEVIDSQLAAAGVRLATLLEDALDKRVTPMGERAVTGSATREEAGVNHD